MAEWREAVAALLERIREKAPLVHNITNYVTVNDVANALLAIGASPIMADALEEAADIASVSSALVINIGTLNGRTVESALAAGKSANERGVPVVFDPVGAGASMLRNEVTQRFMQDIQLAVLRGNLSEISFVAGYAAATKGVDASAQDARNDSVAVACAAARKLGCVVALTGAVDVITDGVRVVRISNGHPMLSRVTGTGCMTSALVGAFAGVTDDFLAAAVGGVASMGMAGEVSFAENGQRGSGSFHIGIIDALSRLCRDGIERKARIDEQQN